MFVDATGRSTMLNVTGEVILYEATVNLGAAVGTLTLQMNATVKQTGTGTGTFKLYLGSGTPGSTVGSTLRVTFTTISPVEEEQTAVSAPFANPGGVYQLQITGVCTDSATSTTQIRGVTVEAI